jgi:ABC-type antimicrobial peptide transport system permease subunit
MRIRDYLVLGWDQLRRRKVVTLLCVMGIGIGSASIVVSLAFGESISHYSQQQMSHYFKTDEISIQNQSSGGRSGAQLNLNDYGITEQKMKLIRSLPHVKSVASFENLNSMEFIVDNNKSGRLNIIATDLTTLEDFGMEFQQGALLDLDNTIVLSYAATVGLQDSRLTQMAATQQQQLQSEMDAFNDRRNAPVISYPLYRKQIVLKQSVPMADGNVRTLEFPVRVVAIEKRAESMNDDMLRYSQKNAYISPGLAKQMQETIAAISGQSSMNNRGMESYREVKVKVDSVDAVAKTDKMIQSLKLNTQTNLNQQESMNKEFVIVRIIFGGAGLFILFVASISIVVAMTMSTHQRKRQIGIMKVLGANLKQIRNMFVVESTLLGLIGGIAGICLSYWVIWGINIIVINFSGGRPGENPEILFISFWILPVGLAFALLTGVMSGIIPAIKASRTDALTAIKRE